MPNGQNKVNNSKNNSNQGKNFPKKQVKLPSAIPSPYNFVPLSKTVFFPDFEDKSGRVTFAEKVFMEVPFRDGLSGHLDICLTACSPIFIRGVDGDSRFFRIGENFAIPGTSLKGVIRNVLEIATFGKMGDNAADNHRYSVRDLKNKDLYLDKFTHNEDGVYVTKVKPGWLKKDKDGNPTIYPCEFARIEQSKIENGSEGKIGESRAKPGEREPKYPARDKYAQVRHNTDIEGYIQDNESVHEHSIDPETHKPKKLKYRGYSASEMQGYTKKKGKLVFTGQPSPRGTGKPGVKHMEFIFFDEKQLGLQLSERTDGIPVGEKFKEFIFIHSKPDKKPNEEWGYWEPKYQENESVPVFYLTEGKSLKSFGLAMMYRLPYEYSIKETIIHTSPEHYSANSDFVETLFGRVVKDDSLRGRVQFGNLIADSAVESSRSYSPVLGSPKPTYYPNYIVQDNPLKKFKTYMDTDAKIRGWKRYLPHFLGQEKPGPINNENKKVQTTFIPLCSNATFKGRIYIHNVTEEELGALVWALTWGGDNKLVHKIGMAKPLGYGSAKITIEKYALVNSCNIRKDETLTDSYCRGKFVEYVRSKIDNWDESCQIKSLLKSAEIPILEDDNNALNYPSLNAKEFVGFVGKGMSLRSLLKDASVEAKLKYDPPKSAKQQEMEMQAEQLRLEALSPEEKILEGISKMTLFNASEIVDDALKLNPGKDVRTAILKKLEVIGRRKVNDQEWKRRFSELEK